MGRRCRETCAFFVLALSVHRAWGFLATPRTGLAVAGAARRNLGTSTSAITCGRGRGTRGPLCSTPMPCKKEGEAAGTDEAASAAIGLPSIAARGGCLSFPSASSLAENEAMHRADIETSEWMWAGCVAADDLVAARNLGWRHFGFPRRGAVEENGEGKGEGEGDGDGEGAPPPHFGSGDLLRVSSMPIMTESECEAMIREAEADMIGWHRETTVRYGVPVARQCSKLPVDELNWSYTFVNEELLPRLVPAIRTAFPGALASARLRLQVCRILKYDAARGHIELGLHMDGPLVTAVVALNDPGEYDGGGTMIDSLLDIHRQELKGGADLAVGGGKEEQEEEEDVESSGGRGKEAGGGVVELRPLLPRGTAVRLGAGQVLLHPGAILHGGAPITLGVRYALALFFSESGTVEHVKHCELRAERSLSAAAKAVDGEERARLIEIAARHYSDSLALGACVDPDIVDFLSKNGFSIQA